MDSRSPEKISEILQATVAKVCKVVSPHNPNLAKGIKVELNTIKCLDFTAPKPPKQYTSLKNKSDIMQRMVELSEKTALETGVLDLSVPMHKSGIPEENLPRKKRRIEEVVENVPQEMAPQDLTTRSTKNSENVLTPTKRNVLKDKENNKNRQKDGKGDIGPEKTEIVVNSMVAKAMKIWYDEDVPGALSFSQFMTSPIKNSPINLSMSKSISATCGRSLDFEKSKDGTRSPRNKSPKGKDIRMGTMPLSQMTTNPAMGRGNMAEVLHAQLLQEAALRESLAQQTAIAQSLPHSENQPVNNATTSGHPYMKLKQMLHRKYANSLNESLDSSATMSSPEIATPTNKAKSLEKEFGGRRLSLDSSSGSLDQSVMETPSGERLYRCNICFKAFTFSTNLTRHQRNIHGKPYRRRTKEMVHKGKDDSKSRSVSPIVIAPKPAPEISVPPKEPSPNRKETLELKPENLAPKQEEVVKPQIKPRSEESFRIPPERVANIMRETDLYADSVSSADEADRPEARELATENNSGIEKISLLSELVSALNSDESGKKEMPEDLRSVRSTSTLSVCTERRGELTEDEDEDRLVIAEEEHNWESETNTSQCSDIDPLPLLQETKFQVLLPSKSEPATTVTQSAAKADVREASPPKSQVGEAPFVAAHRPREAETVVAPIDLLPGMMPNFPIPNILPSIWPCVEPENQWRFKCFECGVAFPFWKGLSKHLQDVHKVGGVKEASPEVTKAVEDHKCKICGRIFAAAPNLRRHIKNVHGKAQQKSVESLPIGGGVVCNLCGQTFLLPAHLAQHMRTTHTLVRSDTTGGIDISRFDNAENQPRTQPQEPKEADTADARAVLAQRMAMLPSQNMNPSAMAMYSAPIQQHFHFLKEALSRRMPINISQHGNNSDSENQKPEEHIDKTVRDVPFNLQDFILQKVVQEVKAAGTNLAGEEGRSIKSDAGASKQTDSGKENEKAAALISQQLPGAMQPVNDRLAFPAKSDGKRHICGLCGASFTFQTNLTRHQRKLHGKPYVRRGSTGFPFTNVPKPEGDKIPTP